MVPICSGTVRALCCGFVTTRRARLTDRPTGATPTAQRRRSPLRLDLVFPAHNEEHRIDRTLEVYRRVLADPDVRFTVALDGCVDGTAAVAAQHAAVDPRLGWTAHPKLGKGGVLAEAFRASAAGDADLIAFVDADGATPPAELLRLVRAVEAGADVAVASRRHPAAVTPGRRSLGRRMASAGFAWGIGRLFRVPCADTQCGAKVLRADVVRRVAPFLSSRDFLFDVDLLHTARRLGCSIAEVPTVWVDQPGSRLRAGRDARRMLLSGLRLWLHHRVIPVEGSRDEVVVHHPPAPRHRPTPLEAPHAAPAVSSAPAIVDLERLAREPELAVARAGA